ncbi:MAG: MFS transporter [Clostridia bacterium]|nr:MFS transporter [Clostridia bacterium]
MKNKVLTPEQSQRLQNKREKEIRKWEKEKARPQRAYYMAFLVFIICVVYITDEIASQIGTLMKTEIATDLLAKYGESSIGFLDIAGMVAIPFSLLSLFYKPLADRYGRKLFLIINTFGMSLAMFIIFLSGNLYVYLIGVCVMSFFVPHDMQVVYIMETAPPKYRATMYSLVKAVATFGIMLVPLLRRMLMTENSQWRMVYLVPAVIGMVISFIALIFTKETDAFIDSRLRHLKMSDEEREKEKLKKDSQGAQGGFVAAVKFVAHHKQLRWLYVTVALSTIGVLITMHYQTIISYGYAENYLAQGLFSSLEKALNSVAVNEVTSALFLFPIGSGIAQLVHGFISDKWGRKCSSVVVAVITIISLVLFSLGSKQGWSPYIVGLFSGASVGAFWSCGDIIALMVSESAPTNLRSSIISTQFLAMGFGYIIAYGVGLPLITALGNSAISKIVLYLALPGLLISLVVLIAKVKETKGANLHDVTGSEWD